MRKKTNPEVEILTSEIDPALTEEYRKLKEKCDYVISKVKKRRQDGREVRPDQ
jgi:hypothetical protein